MELSRQVLVSELSPEVTEDDLELLFESQSFCPDGGAVEFVEVDADTHTAVVTLEDECVAARLAAKSEVYYYGQRLSLTSYTSVTPISSLPESERWKHELLSDSAMMELPVDQRSVRGDGSQTGSSVANLDAADDVDDDSGDYFSSEENTTTATSSPPRRQCLNSELLVADWFKLTDRDKPSCSNSPSLQRCETCPDRNSDDEALVETDEDCELSRDDDDDDSDDDKDDDGDERAEAEQDNEVLINVPKSQLQQNAELTCKLPFSAEKLCLLEKMMAAGNVDFPCTLRVVMAENAVELVAVADENVTESKMKLYELVANFTSISLHLPRGVVKLLQSSRGQSWLQTQLASMNAVFYAKDSAYPFVLGADGKTSSDAKFLLENALSSKKITFGDQHVTFLKSSQWADAVGKFESEFFVTVSTEYRENEIVVEGSIDALNDISKSLEMMLRQNGIVQRKINMSADQFQLLLHFRVEIHDKLKSVTSQHQQNSSSSAAPLDVKFDENLKCLTVTGLTDNVEAATKFIKTNYLDVVCTDNLEIVQPGLRLEDFGKESHGEMVIEYLQMKHKCVIAVQDSAVSTRPSISAAVAAAESSKHSEIYCEREEREHSLQTSAPQILIVEGSLTDFMQADVLVNVISSKTPDLSRAGAVSAAFLDAAGDKLQDELEDNWPQFGEVVRTRSYGHIQAKHIYHCAVPKYKNPQSVQLLQKTVEKCLIMAEKDGVSSIAFPTVGCGKLGFDPKSVAHSFVQAQRNTQSTVQMYIVAYEPTLRRTFKSFTSAPESQLQSLQSMQPSLMTPTNSSSSLSIEVKSGSLPDFEADVLVNVVANATPNLAKAGVVSSCFLRRAGPALQREFSNQSPPSEFGHDITVTSAAGLQAKCIYHAAVRPYRDEHSVKLLYDTIKLCLVKATAAGMTSVAFPTVGCGRFGYDPCDVADCFLRAQRDTGCQLRVCIVSFENELHRQFKTYISAAASGDMEETSAAQREVRSPQRSTFHKIAKKVSSLFWRSESPASKLTFRICALSKSTVATVKESLQARLEGLVNTSEIRNDEVATLSSQDEMKITALRSVDVGIEIDKAKSLIRLTGKKEHVDKTNREILVLLQPPPRAANEVDLDRVKKTEGVSAYLRVLGSESQVRYPAYWQSVRNADFDLIVGSQRQKLKPADALYKEVENLAVRTWEVEKVGQGRDASNLSHSRIAVRNIWVIENPSLFAEYTERKKRLCKVAGVNQLPPRISGLKGEHEVRTQKCAGSQLNKNLVGEINEYFLFHGTKQNGLKSIEDHGLDSRLSTNAMFGNGVYFAESFTKADQYADSKTTRSRAGQSLYVFVSRVLLGNAFVCGTPTPYKRPPCSHSGCPSVSGATPCQAEAHCGVTFDSVIGTHRDGHTRLIFREFVIYEKSLSYPEFLVEYIRQ